MKSKDHDDRHDHDGWDRELGFGDTIVLLCEELGRVVEQIIEKKVSAKGEVGQIEELRRVQYVVREIGLTRKVTACHVQTFKAALSEVSAGSAAKGRGALSFHLLLEAIVITFDNPRSPIGRYLLIHQAAGSPYIAERKWLHEIEGVPALESLSGHQELERLQGGGVNLAGAMQRVSACALEAAASWRNCSRFQHRAHEWREVGVALREAERVYAELLCDAESINRLQVDSCIDYLSRRLVPAGMLIEICRVRYNEITMTNARVENTAAALEAFARWAGAMTAEVRAIAEAHSCAAMGTVQKRIAAYEQRVKEFVSLAGVSGVAEHVLAQRLDALDADLAAVEECAEELDVDYFPWHVVRRGYGEISRVRHVLSDCGCDDSPDEVTEAVAVILKALAEWDETTESFKAEKERRVVSREFAERICKLVPALRTVWTAIAGGRVAAAGPVGGPLLPVDPGRVTQPPSVPMPPGLRYPIAQLEAYGARLNAAIAQKTVSTDRADELQREFDTVSQLVTDPSGHAINPVAADVAQRIALEGFAAKLAAAEVLQSRQVGRLTSTVLPGRHFVELPAVKGVIKES